MHCEVLNRRQIIWVGVVGSLDISYYKGNRPYNERVDAFNEKNNTDVQRKVEDGPYMLSRGISLFNFGLIKIEKVGEVLSRISEFLSLENGRCLR